MTDAEVRATVGFWMLSTGKEPRRVVVTVVDYVYEGWLVGVAKKRNGVVRVNVEDVAGRLFIHSAAQVRLLTDDDEGDRDARERPPR